MSKKKKLILTPYDDDDAPPQIFNVGLHPYAMRDREAIYEYILEKFGVRVAIEKDDKLLVSLLQLKETPYKSRYGRVAGTRELVIYPNYAAFVVWPPDVIVLRIVNGARLWPEKQLARLAVARTLSVAAYL